MTDDELLALLARVADELGARIDGLFSTVNRLARRVDDLHDRARERGKQLDRSGLAGIRPLIHELLGLDDPLLEGLGIATSPNALTDTSSWLEWWRKDPDHQLGFIKHALDPTAVGFYDYHSRDWFMQPSTTDAAAAVGPYIDAGGIEVYTVTLAVPIELAPAERSVVGGDLSMAAMEAYLVHELGVLDPPIALVASNDRILVSNNARRVMGSKLQPTDLHAVSAQVPIPTSVHGRVVWRLMAWNSESVEHSSRSTTAS